ncbi:MAG: hypothetical protein O2840_03615 [bacterium]|nr:hypothetical protein [bacterium]
MIGPSLEHEFPSGRDRFIFYGTGVGRKTTRLVEQASLQADIDDLLVLGGVGIGAEVSDIQEVVQQMYLPAGCPVVVRSSAFDEDGGTGRYDSHFFMPTGDRKKDEERLIELVSDVRQSLDRTTIFPPEKMGVLIQRVVGDKYPDFVSPAFSGVLTVFNGRPILRFAIGMATRVVSGGDALLVDLSSVEQLDAEDLESQLQSLSHADVVANTGVATIEITDDLRLAAANCLVKLQELISGWLQMTREKGDTYLEFAITNSDNKPIILQSHPIVKNDDEGSLTEFLPGMGGQLFEGNDTVGRGVREGNLVIVLEGKRAMITRQDMKALFGLNLRYSNYLLVVPPMVISRLVDEQLELRFSHFSNAAAVIESKGSSRVENKRFSPGLVQFLRSHTGTKGGTHFAGICMDQNILFLGLDGDTECEGAPSERVGNAIRIYDTPFRVQNLVSGMGRLELGESGGPRAYTEAQLLEWIETIHNALKVGETSEEETSWLTSLLDVLDGNFPKSSNSTYQSLTAWKPQQNDKRDRIIFAIDSFLKSDWLPYLIEDSSFLLYLAECRKVIET